jgi:hypothetical protein
VAFELSHRLIGGLEIDDENNINKRGKDGVPKVKIPRVNDSIPVVTTRKKRFWRNKMS